MPISCHFRDPKALLATSLARVTAALFIKYRTFTFTGVSTGIAVTASFSQQTEDRAFCPVVQLF